MTTFRTVLCPIDFSDLTEPTVQLAAVTARRLGARLVLHHNLESGPPEFLSVRWMWSEEHGENRRGQVRERSARLTEAFERVPEGVPCEGRLTRGSLDRATVEVASQLPADLIVMGSHGWSDASHRSLTERMIMAAPCPVLTVGKGCDLDQLLDPPVRRPAAELGFLVPIDFTADSIAVVDFAAGMMAAMPHRLHLVHVIPPSPAMDDPRVRSATTEERHRRLAELVPPGLEDRTVFEVRAGDPAREILGAADAGEALFILMPAARPGLFRRVLFGGTTLGVLHGSRCPVWFLPPAITMRRNARQAL
jgi:nucleotide-binding universal stress UspA family protein